MSGFPNRKQKIFCNRAIVPEQRPDVLQCDAETSKWVTVTKLQIEENIAMKGKRLNITKEMISVQYGNYICDALRDLLPFVQFRKREKHPWRSVTFSKVAGFSLKVPLLHGYFSYFYIV